MARRGFFAELQRQIRIAEREKEQRVRESVRNQGAVARNLEQSRRAAERAYIQFSKAQAAEQKSLEKAARAANVTAKEAEVEQRNAELADMYSDIDTLLRSTLSRDDFVDLSTLSVEPQHPPFDRPHLETPLPLPPAVADPEKPELRLPEAPRGLASLFGKKKHAEAVAAAERAYADRIARWKVKCEDVERLREAARNNHAGLERRRVEELERERARYAEECLAREADAAAKNQSLAELITNLGYGTADAVQEYVSIVLSNSVYPDHFSVSHEFTFDPETAELNLRVEIPDPSRVPSVKTYKYAKAADEIVSTSLSQKECRERYTSAVYQVALRSFHEVFEADRRGLIKTVALEVGTTALDLGTGQRRYVPFVIAAAERETFLSFDLSAVVPAMTLTRLGAAVSQNPYVLLPVAREGVRRT